MFGGVTSIIDKGKVVGVVYFDFQLAIDKVSLQFVNKV